MDKWYIMHAIIDVFKKCEFDGSIAIGCYSDEISINITDKWYALSLRQIISIEQLNQLNGESKTVVDMHIRTIVEGMITLINERKTTND